VLRFLALLAVLSVSMAGAGTARAASPLAGQWHLDAVGPGPSTPDSSGNGLSATSAGAINLGSPTSGRFGNALAPASTSILSAGSSPLLAPARVTLVAWINRTGSPGTLRYIAGRGDDGNTCLGSSYAIYTGYPGNAGLKFYVRETDGNNAATAAPPDAAVFDGTWHMVAGVYDGSFVHFYLDGVEVGSPVAVTAPIKYDFPGSSFYIDGYPVAFCQPPPADFTGSIDEVRLYDRALNPAELRSMATAPGTSPPDLQGDADQDGVPDASDNCPANANDQADADADGIGDVCDPTPLPPPPPGPPAERTLLGLASYEPAFGVGFNGLEVLGPFAAAPTPREVTVRLRGPDGPVIREQRVLPRDPRPDGRGPVGTGQIPYRFDNLGACAGCVVELLGDSTVQDSRRVSFDGDAGQTDIDLSYGLLGRGGVLTGAVLAPSGTVARQLSVEVIDAGGKTLADTSTLKYRCGSSAEACPTAPSYSYRLVGLPASGTVRVVLRQGAESRRSAEADAVTVALDPSGTTAAPDLAALADFPGAVSGRTLYGQVNDTAPFAPGARNQSDLGPSAGEGRVVLEVELRDADGSVQKRQRDLTVNRATGYVGYALTGLDACNGCTVALVKFKKTLARLPVTIPKTSPSVTRRDLDYARDGEPEYLNGTVIANDVRAKRIGVVVADAVTGKRLAASAEGDDACGSGTRCPVGGEQAYRIGSVPPNRDVVVTLVLDKRAADSRRLRTAPAGEVTQVPALIVPRGKGPRSLQVQVVNAGPYAPGRTPAEPAKPVTVTARLLSSAGTEVATASARLSKPEAGADYNALFLDALEPCAGCSLELATPDGVEDRAPVEVRSESPSVAIASVGWRRLTGGAYVEGKIVDRSGRLKPAQLSVQVLSSSGRVLSDSAKVPAADTRPDRESFNYRLGGIPRDAGKVKIVVLGDKRQRLASTTVTIAPGGADAHVPDLRLG
jgi:Concanavalin A-like lectin/glucanases superfamily